MSDNVALDNPRTQFIRPCNLCPHMKRITLAGIYDCLLNQRYAIEIPAAIATPARRAIERMLSLPKLAQPARFETGRAPVAVSLMTN